MSLPDRITLPDLMLELAKVKPAPVSRFAFPCPRCRYENPNVAMGCYTAEGLQRHLLDVHGTTGVE